MKKFLSIMLVLTLLLSLGVSAFADTISLVDKSTVVIKKNYQLTNPGTSSPEETFDFTIERTSVTDAGVGINNTNMPLPTIGTVGYNEGEAGSATATKDITVTLPLYESVGIYTYTINENAKSKAGVTYYVDDIKLVVTVIEQNGKVRVAAVHTEEEGGEKNDCFSNIYSAGDLEISKTVTGNLGDKAKYFDVTVTLTGVQGKVYDNPYVVTGGSELSNPTTISVGTSAIFKIKDSETIKIANLPYGVTYTVVETDYTGEGYSAEHAYSDTAEVKEIDKATETVGITNNKTADVDTGISLDSIPYILLLAGAIIGMGVLFFKKRQNANY